MDSVRVLTIKKSIFESNDARAQELRNALKSKGVFLLNLMSSPGSGKTTLLLGTLEYLKPKYRLAVLEADIDSDVDARKIKEQGIDALQIHTGGMCHMDAGMTEQGLEALGMENYDAIFLENIGNLICTAQFDTGASRNVIILSVPEGSDKPLKYPIMFEMADVLIINKIDALNYFNFDIDEVMTRVSAMNLRIKIFPLSAKDRTGFGAWIEWLSHEIEIWKN